MAYAAALPALAILAGVVVGSFAPGSLVPLPAALLIAGWACAFVAIAQSRPTVAWLSLALTFGAGGWLLAGRATLAAGHPPLRAFFDRAVESSDRTSTDLLFTIEGRLRQDAALTASGVSLSVEVGGVLAEGAARDTDGGVQLTVSGTLARDRFGEWRAGRTLRMPAVLRRPSRYLDPGVPDHELALARRGTTLVGLVKSGALVEVVARGSWMAEATAAARAAARRTLDRAIGVWSGRSAAIVTALLIGDRAGLDDETERRLQEAGTYHVIAISGGNIAILAAILFGAFRALAIGPRVASAAAIVLLIVYASLVGGGSSVVRATLMAVIYLSARLFDHRSPPLNALAVAAAIVVTVTPLAIFDAGFALTFGATLAILLIAPRAAPRLPRALWLRAPASLLVASVAAEAALFPVAAYAFSRVTFAGLALNFVAIPLMTVAQVLGLAVLGIGAISAGGASLVGYLAHLAAAGLVESAALVDLAPWLTYRVPPPSLAVCAIYYAGAIAWLDWPADVRGREGWRGWARRGAQAIAIASAFWILAAPWSLRRASPGALRVAFLDVGQGDAALVRFPDGRSLVVDCGGLGAGASFDVGERVVSPALRALGVRALDYLALTHGDPDHIGGAPAVIRDFTPSEVWEGVPVPPYEPLRLLASTAARSRAAWRTLRAGDRVRIGGVDVRLWHPPPPDWERQQVRNDDSLVIDLRFGNVSVLLAGDIGREVERELAPALEDAGLRVIKVPHHGSATSSSVEFLRAARPAIAVFSAGRGNRYGHPVPFVIERYRDLGAAIFRTDQDGAVLLETNGETVGVRTWTGRQATFRAP